MDDVVCHVADAAGLAGDWLAAEPFLHCCTEDQLPFVLERWFAGVTGLVVVRFGPKAVDGQVVWEASEPGMEPFPHVYGRVRLSGVLSVEAVQAPAPIGRS